MVSVAPLLSLSPQTARPAFLEAPADIKDPTARQWYEEARRLYQEGRDKKAQKRLNQAVGIVIKIDPALAASLWNNTGVALCKMGDVTREQRWYKEALKCFEKALKIDPGFAEASYNKGVTLAVDLGRPLEEALDCFDNALRIDPGLAPAWCNKGAALSDLGRPLEEALDCFDKALKIDPKYAQAWYNKAVALKGLGRQEEAQKALERAEFEEFCTNKNLRGEVSKIIEAVRTFYNTREGVEVSTKVVTDPEIEDYKVIDVQITLRASPEEVLKREAQFNSWFVENIPLEKQPFFATTYHLLS